MSENTEPTLLEQFRAKLTEQIDSLAVIVDKRDAARAEYEKRSEPTEDEATAETAAEKAFNAEFDKRQTEIARLERRVAEQEVVEKRAKAAAESNVKVSIVSEPMTYRKDNGHTYSYFRDLASVSPSINARMGTSPSEARERLEKHGKETAAEEAKRNEARTRKTTAELNQEVRGGLQESPFEQRADANRTQGEGGYFVPPLWLVDEYIPYLRAGRPAADSVRKFDLPAGTDSINIPVLSGPTKVEYQAVDGEAVEMQPITDSAVQANVKTLAGDQDIALQLLEQSPGQIIDRVIMEDLMASYNALLDTEVLVGPGTNTGNLNGGKIKGLKGWAASGNNVTWTTASEEAASPAGFLAVLGGTASKIATNRFDVSSLKYVIHPRRWYWFASQISSDGRPLVSAGQFGPFNAAALTDGSVAEGNTGVTLLGHPVILDANLPLESGKDQAIAFNADDAWLFEGSLKTRVLPEVLSGTLQIRFQVYNYVAFLDRYANSISVASGTGFAAPTGPQAVTF